MIVVRHGALVSHEKKSENVFKGSSIGFCLRWLWEFDGVFVNGNFADAAASMMFRQSRINL